MLEILSGAGPALVAAAAVVTAVTVIARPVWRAVAGVRNLGRRAGHFFDDWAGQEPRDGVPGRPGVMVRLAKIEERVATVEHEVQHNNGGSLKDAVRRTETAVADLAARVDELAARPTTVVQDVTVTPPVEP